MSDGDRTRSFWAWGYEDELLDESDREDLAAFVEEEFGFPERPRLDYPELANVTLPESRLEVPDELADFCAADKETRVRHTYGRSWVDRVRGFRENFDSAPDLVTRPENETQLRAVLEWASENGAAVVPVGGGTSVVGGVEGDVDGDFAGVVSVNLREFDELLEVDETSRSAKIQAGKLGPDINDELADYGLNLRHYPQSYRFSTLGGWLATHAGGHYATNYTHIDDFVENVRMVAPDGEIETRRLPSSGAGPDPNELVLGSEGMLGIITEAWMDVVPRPPYSARATMHFDEFDDVVTAARRVVQSGLTPANCRVLDKHHARLNQLTPDADTHLLLLGFEANDALPEEELDRAMTLAEDEGGRCPAGPFYVDETTDEDDRGGSEPEQRWREEFFRDPYRTDAFISLGVMRRTFETAVTWDQFPDLHADVTEAAMDAMERVCGTGFLATRFTHVYPEGPAPYYTMLAPVDPDRAIEQAEEIKRAAVDTVIDHGGTTTHHHAVGRAHKPWYHRETPEDYREALRAMKQSLDPEGVMNPGVLID